MPDGRQINYLYYGSSHLHQINLDGEVVSDIERDKLHREIQRTQGALISRYELDPVGRLKKQIAALDSLSESGKGKVAAGYGQTAVKRSYGYDKTGNLLHSSEQRTGTTHFEYDKLGRITQAGNERFAFDPAHNILSDGIRAVADNRIKTYNGTSYYHDELGNLIHRELPDGEVQNYFYDLHDQLVKAEIFKKDGTKETWLYTYDALGRRIGKGRLKEDGSLEEEREFVWDGSHLLQEVYANGRYTYIYTDVDSYEPLAQIHNYTNSEGETYQETNYFHCDQIGIPREMTDKEGNLIWFGNYQGWGKLKEETNITGAHQPFRLQNQYCDRETGLHYNFFRYYEPECGRFINQDPIGLSGGDNLYHFAPNTQGWIDELGLLPIPIVIGAVALIARGAVVAAKFATRTVSKAAKKCVGKCKELGKPKSPDKLLKNGEINYKDVQKWAKRKKLPNQWKSDPQKFPTGGFKYSDGKYSIHGHGANPAAQAKFPGSNAAQGPTVRITGPNGSLRTDGTWGKFKSDPNGAHIPLKNSPY